jgi:hypothetical protein
MSIRVMAAAVAAAAGLAIATCGPADAVTAGHAAPAATRAVQLTGVQLRAALLPASAFPAGYKLDKSGVYDSGAHLLTVPAKYHLATMSCASFAKHFGFKGFGESAVAGDAFVTATFNREFGQQVYQFRTSRAAAAFFGGLRAIARRCPKFLLTESGLGASLTTKVFDASSIAGHRTFQANEAGTIMGFRLGLKLVFTLAGPDVFMTGNVGVFAAPPTSPAPRTTMLRLIKRVRAAR